MNSARHIRILIGVCLLGLGLVGCSPAAPAIPATITPAAAASTGPAIPGWMEKIVQKLRTQPRRNPPVSISRYRYQDQTVYYIPAGVLVQSAILYDEGGEVLCQPGKAGSAGCPDFFEKRRDGVTIWLDVR
jgi:hypothetical protein